jgi:hypothetical protein
MFKYTRQALKKVEEIFEELAFKIRYEKGNFKSGYCIVDNTDIIVINRFFNTEARINVLIEIIEKLKIQEASLSETNAQTLRKVRKFLATTNDVEKVTSD